MESITESRVQPGFLQTMPQTNQDSEMRTTSVAR